MHFSNRTHFGAEADPLTEAVALRRRAGLPVLDLTESNPTRCGLGIAGTTLLPPLSHATNMVYRAEPFGPMQARKAVAKIYYRERGVQVDPAEMVLTASTSEAYSFLFRLFCEPGDHVLVPQPSYPLFDLLARISDVETVPYPLRFHEFWETDLDALEAAITPRTRAIVVVHPNNPTGHFTSPEERQALDRIAARRGLPLLVDEVFLDYPAEPQAVRGVSQSFAASSQPDALTFVMSGLSKVLALPQMKLAWTLVLGPEPLRREALHRLEYIADTFLSVAAPAANAMSDWLQVGASVQAQGKGRIQSNLTILDREIAGASVVSRLPVEGGWSVLLRLPALEADTDFALRLLHATGVLVHPGSFFALPGRGWVVLSLLPEPESFERGVRLLVDSIEKWLEVTL
ncbi:pyridoxal phosphate-dependent aminotransferase [Terriglobus aquaticus]|uniref:Pyridoxal phosphate-dependent aminotransferase n=1 Tax=Terriglobus aquaticus TaxID=940139 RepID=A0ABW9KL89_9BACT|nr:pyridoxal phosphate-dependent aminotransferase [Terriglobus aquaticus]